MIWSELWEMVKDRETWHAIVHGVQRVGHDWVTGWQQPSQETSLTTHLPKSSLQVKRELCQGMFYTGTLLGKSVLSKWYVPTHGKILRYAKYGKPKCLTKGKPEEMPHKNNSNCHEGWLSNSGTLPLSLPVCVSTCRVLFFLLKNYSLASLLSFFVEILFFKAEGPEPLSLTTGLMVRIWSFHHQDPIQSLSGNPSPISSHCSLRPPEIRVSCIAHRFFTKWNGENSLTIWVISNTVKYWASLMA